GSLDVALAPDGVDQIRVGQHPLRPGPRGLVVVLARPGEPGPVARAKSVLVDLVQEPPYGMGVPLLVRQRAGPQLPVAAFGRVLAELDRPVDRGERRPDGLSSSGAHGDLRELAGQCFVRSRRGRRLVPETAFG